MLKNIHKEEIRTAFILGSNSREVNLAKRLEAEGYIVHVMSYIFNPNLTNSNIIFHKDDFNLNIIQKINPDYVFAFNEKYVFSENVNNELHQNLGKNTKVCIPKTEHLFLEQDKHKVKQLLGKDDMVKVSSQEEFDRFLEEKGKIFVRINSPYHNTFQIFETGKTISQLIDFKNSEVLLEPFYQGENITFTYYIDNGAITILPTVFDYPYYISSSGEFVKTSGNMCKYSSSKNDELNIEDIAQEVKNDISKIIPSDYCGFLSAQILYDKENQDYHFVELDVKVGEPEFINVIKALDEEFDNVLNNKNDTYIANSKANESLSVAVACEKFPEREIVYISNYRELLENSNEEFYYSSVDKVGQDDICNTNGGRIGFVYQEGKSKQEIMHKLIEYKKTHLNVLKQLKLDMFLLDDNKKLIELHQATT